MQQRYLGFDLGAETIKVVELVRQSDGAGPALTETRRRSVEHFKSPAETLARLVAELDWSTVTGAAATGRLSRLLALPRVPTKAALARGVVRAYPHMDPGTVVSIGSHGFSALELRPGGHQVFRENSRCSQGTGNFLRQLVERFDLTPEQASDLCADVATPAALSGRCPVILKTDMTHLANRGEPREAILAGLYDAVCENVQVLLKPGLSPSQVLLCGGVSRAPRVRARFREWLAERDMHLLDVDPEETLFLEALGAASVAATSDPVSVALDALIRGGAEAHFEELPPLRDSLDLVTRMPPVHVVDDGEAHRVVLGFDIGSTGSKALAIDASTRQPVWEGYRRTLGDPVDASRALTERFLAETAGRHHVAGLGATGSGREISGSLMASALGAERVFVLNEIAAHATGALHFDPEVDTIFEIGGQDAKYVRLDGGRICDAAMNEACSAGTGSFIEEQGSKFEGVQDVAQMGQHAVQAERGISLGQHCSVFMAEIIDEAVAGGVDQGTILAGLYDSIVQNYLNRVKGNRSIGQRIFCQGMPFASDALAAAVARQTGRQVIIPPNPGTIGALGIALLAADELDLELPALELRAFLAAELLSRDTFACHSSKGCGGSGNLCRIDRMVTQVGGKKQKFVWGGHCSLYDKGTRVRKLPDLAPDPFRQRREMVDALIERVHVRRGLPLVAMSEEFVLKGLLPFFASFVRGLGFDVKVLAQAGQKALKRGIECASVPFCAPMQLYHGVIAELLDDEPDILLAPRLRELPRVKDEPESVTCPIVQGSPEIIARLIPPDSRTRVVASRVDMGPGDLHSAAFTETMRMLARELGVEGSWEPAFWAARAEQERFDERLAALGREALAFAKAHDVVPVVVLGRTYTLYNDVLNSNVPSLLREQGALAIPVDCYPVHDEVPVFPDLFWGYSQVNLRAAHQIRRSDGVYSVFCSNYSCGPDSFNLHFFSYVMENKPFAIIETDGHAGDAGTRTRIEAFLYCVQEDLRLERDRREARLTNSFVDIESDRSTVKQAWDRGELMLLPRMGPSADVMAAALRSEGMRAQALPMPERSTLRRGREFTSGKECVPMTITLGSILERLDSGVDHGDRVALFMPTACGPCRFGVYNLLHKIIIEKTGNKDHVRVVSPSSSDYFEGMSTDFRLRVLVAVVAGDLLLRARQWTGPVEREPGAAQAIYERWFARLLELLEASKPGNLVPALGELSGKMFGVRELIRQASVEFRSAVGRTGFVPTVSVVGEIYARLDPFTNEFVTDQLEARGIRALLAPMHEWFEYTTFLKQMRIREGRPVAGDHMFGAQVSYALELVVTAELWDIFAADLGWGERVGVEEAMRAAGPWLNPELRGEAVLTLGTPVAEHLHGDIDGVVAVGPHECMPNKLAEAQFVHVGEELGLTSLTLPLNGDPLDPEVIDRFVFEVREAFERRSKGLPQHHRPALADRVRALRTKALARSLKILRPFGGTA